MFFQLKFCIFQIILGCLYFKEVTLRSKPFNGLVSIKNEEDRHLCGGILIDLDFVITSASCLIKSGSDNEFYESSELSVMNHTLDEKTRKSVHSVFVHADYLENPKSNVAILHVEPFDDTVDILTAIDSPEPEENCKIVGWLRQKNLQRNPSFQTSSVSIIKNDLNDKINVRANYPCYGPGSALVCDDILSGLGSTCQQRGQSTNVFADLSKYNGWIDSIVRAIVFNDSSLLNNLIYTKKHEDENNNDRIIFDIDRRVEQSSENPESIKNSQQNETLLHVCTTCYKECISTWFNFQNLQDVSHNNNCRRGVSYPYTCIYMVKQFVYEKDDASNVHEDGFTKYVNEYSTKFWKNYQTYVQQFMKPISFKPFDNFSFSTPLPWNFTFNTPFFN